MIEPTYTLDEARTEMVRRECERDGHSPDVEVRTVAELVGIWYCRCLRYEWRATSDGGPGNRAKHAHDYHLLIDHALYPSRYRLYVCKTCPATMEDT